MVLPSFVRQAIADAPLTVHGDGSQTRSFTWVGDVVNALTSLMQDARAAGQIFNVGNDTEVSILDLALRVRAAAGSDSQIEFVPYKHAYDADFEDMPRRVPDISKLRNLIGYQPRVALPEIIERTLRYWREQPGAETRRVVPVIPRRQPILPASAANERKVGVMA